MLCKRCPKRIKSKCVSLCAKAEAYVNQDEIKQQHLIPKKAITYSRQFPVLNIPIKDTKRILRLALTRRFKQSQIAELTGFSQGYVSKVINKEINGL